MEGIATTVEVDALKKSIHDMVELAKNKDMQYEELIKNTVTSVLQSHPGFTPER